ncbi:MAG TPA: GNAT family N-acetyltransferase [Micromonosporaceae bacterium]|jgi:GNAT superfamily N-acetyltransferase
MANGFVRPARPFDASEIARIQLATWRTAYRRLLPRLVLAELDEAWMAEQWLAAIEGPPSSRHHIMIAIEQTGPPPDESNDPNADPTGEPVARSHVVGFVATGPADEAALAPDEKPLPETTAAITDLLVEPRWGRRGHGSRLLASAVDGWRSEGFDTAVAWAYDRDPATRAFLSSAGWEPDGATRALDVDDLLVNQLRLHVALDFPDAESAET